MKFISYTYHYRTGLAWIKTICSTNGQSSSAIEEMGDYSSIITAAHELGHRYELRDFDLSTPHKIATTNHKNTCSISSE